MLPTDLKLLLLLLLLLDIWATLEQVSGVYNKLSE
jgi:hypothetical protein